MTENEKYHVIGMTCAACQAHVDKAVRRVDGVKEVSVNLLTNSMLVTYDSPANHQTIESAVSKAGYKAICESKNGDKVSHNEGQQEDDETKKLFFILLMSFILLIPLVYISMGYMLDWPIGILSTRPFLIGLIEMVLSGIILLINRRFFISGFKSLIHGSPNMDTLVALGSGVAFLYSSILMFVMAFYVSGSMTEHDMHQIMQISMNLCFETTGMVPTLITIGKTLESYSKGKTTNAIKSLLKLAPKTAHVLRNEEEFTVSVDEVSLQDTLIVKPGETIPVDGIVLEGISSVNESALTGESMPIDKTTGDKVSAATINLNGVLKVKPTRIGSDTTLNQIIEMVKTASGTKTKISRVADRVSGVFVPVIIAISILIFTFWLIFGKDFVAANSSSETTLTYAISKAIAVLVIACPCALGLATPVAIMVGSGKGAKNGILFKTASSLEETGKVSFVVLDKTGTLTKGEPEVTDIFAENEKELLAIANALETNSEHPLAKAIVKKAKEENIETLYFTCVQAIPGKGIQGEYQGLKYYAGNALWMKELGLMNDSFEDKSNNYADQGKTPLFFATEHKILGIIAVADVLKEDSKQAIDEFKKMNIIPIMLTGDNRRTAKAIANELGLNTFVSDVLPDGKQAVIQKLQESGLVAMVGDGINDAPALTQADIGIAIGAGSDVAIDSADVVLMKSTLLDAAAAIRLSRHTLTNIKENLFWAFFYNIVMIPIAAGAYVGTGIEWLIKMKPWYGAAAMALSSVTVCLNALRINLFNMYNPKKDAFHKKVKLPEFLCGESTDNNPSIVYEISIKGMMCAHCVQHVTDALNSLEYIAIQEVSLEKGIAIIDSRKVINEKEIESVISDAGYKVLKIERR